MHIHYSLYSAKHFSINKTKKKKTLQARPQGHLDILQNSVLLFCGVTRHFEKYPEGPGDEVENTALTSLGGGGGGRLFAAGHLLNFHHFKPHIFSKLIIHQQSKEERTLL